MQGVGNPARPKIRFTSGAIHTARTSEWSEKVTSHPPAPIPRHKACFPRLKDQFRPKLAFLSNQMR